MKRLISATLLALASIPALAQVNIQGGPGVVVIGSGNISLPVSTLNGGTGGSSAAAGLDNLFVGAGIGNSCTGLATDSSGNPVCSTLFQISRTPPVGIASPNATVGATSVTTTLGSNCTNRSIGTTLHSAYGIRGPVGGLCSTSIEADWTYGTLPSYINPANIIAIYPYSTISSTGGLNTLVCTYNGVHNTNVYPSGPQAYPPTYTVATPSGWGTDPTKVVCSFSAAGSSDGNNRVYNIYDVGLYISYTGSAPPSTSALSVVPPLYVDSVNQTFGINLPVDLGTDQGAANAYIINLNGFGVNNTQPGTTVNFIALHANTTATPTLNFNGFGTATIVGPTGLPLAAGDITTGAGPTTVKLGNDGNWYLQNPMVMQPGSGTGPSQSVVASASTIAPTTPFFHVSGTTTISTITPPAFCVASGTMCKLTLIPNGLWSTTTGGNIAIASTAVVSKALIMTYDPATTTWYPSY